MENRRILETVAGVSLALASSFGGAVLAQEVSLARTSPALAPQQPVGVKPEDEILVPDTTGTPFVPEPRKPMKAVDGNHNTVSPRRSMGNADRNTRRSYVRFLDNQRRTRERERRSNSRHRA